MNSEEQTVGQLMGPGSETVAMQTRSKNAQITEDSRTQMSAVI